MKIAFIVPGFSADEHDWCIPAHTDIVRALAHSHTVHVFAMRYPHRVDMYKIGNATVHSFNGVGSRGEGSARLWLTVAHAVAREHRQERFDVVHSIFGSEAGSVAVLAGKWLRVPSVAWLVNGELVGLAQIGYGADLLPRQRWMNRLILKYAAQVLCGCDNLTHAARTRNSQARVETLPLAVNTRRFHVAPGPERVSNSPRFINVGSLLPVKDQATLLRAFAITLRALPHAHLTIAGDGPLESALRGLANELGITANVTLAGNVSHDALPDLYRGVDVFVQSSLHEGQGMALLEAAACGCALCGTEVGVLTALARDGAAISAPVGSPEELATIMQTCFRERAALRERGRQIVEQEYNLERIQTRLEGVYHRLKQGDKVSFERDIARA